jgi:hypothetical protein
MRWWTNVLAGECWLKLWPNGGTAIFVRTLWITALMYSAALLLRAVPYTDWSFGIRWDKLKSEVGDTVPWVGGIAAGVYTALYARFSSQWTYLANVYHQMKAAILSGPENPSDDQKEQLQYWKAAFVEDAQDLHLVRKPMFALTAWEWLDDDGVSDMFDQYTSGGKSRRIRLEKRLARDLKKTYPRPPKDDQPPDPPPPEDEGGGSQPPPEPPLPVPLAPEPRGTPRAVHRGLRRRDTGRVDGRN